MNKEELAKQITKMYQDLLLVSGVQQIPYSPSFVVFNTQDALFQITYHNLTDEYSIDRSETLLNEYKKRKLDTNFIPDPRTLYSWVNFQHVFYGMFVKQNKDPEHLFHQTLPYTDVVFEPGKNYETYKVYGMENLLYAIGYNKTINKYGFKRYDLSKVLYETLQIPMESKPDYKKLYNSVKDMYMAQCVMENIQHIDEI